MKRVYLTGGWLLVACLSALSGQAQVRGQVYHDSNANGQFDVGHETGIAHILVEALDQQGVRLAAAHTDEEGSYELATREYSLPFQLVFSQLPDGHWPTRGQFLKRFLRGPSGTQNLGLLQPRLYQPDSLLLALSLQPISQYGNRQVDSLGASSLAILDAQTGQRRSVRVDPRQTGSIWGLAYNSYRGLLYAASLAKRHSDFGPLGSGGIYAIDPKNGICRPLGSMDSLGISTAPTGLRNRLGSESPSTRRDSAMFAWAGKAGLGGLTLTPDGTTLYTVNLYDQNVYRVALPPKGQAITRQSLTRLDYTAPRCAGGQFRPFALTYHEGQVYLGGVCDAAQSGRVDQLTAHVLSLDPLSGRTREVLTLPLAYKRGQIDYGLGDWNAWTDNSRAIMLREPAWWAIHPQPILSDIIFTATGNLVLGFMDRLGHQMATGKGTPDGQWEQTVSIAAGDVLQAAPRRAGFKSEANARTGTYQSAGHDNGQGPAGGEFYHEDGFSLNGTQYHQESGMGGLAVLAQQVLVSAREPVPEYNAAGIACFDPNTGRKQSGYVAYHFSDTHEMMGRKTNHVGDIVTLAPAAPLWVGLRIWQDCNENGTPQAGEEGLAGVLVELWQADKKVAQTTSDSIGLCTFVSEQLADGLRPHSTYQLRIPIHQNRYDNLIPTSVTTSATETPESGKEKKQDFVVISLTTKSSGEVQPDLMVGFKCVDKPTANFQLVCQGQEIATSTISVVLKGNKPMDRYLVLSTDLPHVVPSYASAQPIKNEGPIAYFSLNDWLTKKYQFMLINATGCYETFAPYITDQADCLRLLVEVEEPTSRLTIFPNPAKDKVTVTYRGHFDDSPELMIQTLTGQIISRSRMPLAAAIGSQAEIDVSQLPSGVYLISVKEEGKTHSRRLVKP